MTADPPDNTPTPSPPPPPPVAPPPPQQYSPPPPPPPRPTKTEDDYRNELAQTRAEAASHRIAARDAQEQLTKTQNELVTAREMAERVKAEERAKSIARLTNAELGLAGLRSGLQDLDLLALVDKTGVKVNDDYSVTGADEAIAALKAKKPELFREASAPPTRQQSGSNVAPPPTPGGGGPSGVENVRGLNKAEYEARRRQELARLRGRG